MTKGETMLVAASTCPEVFTEWDLTVAAWKLDPQAFCMQGYLEYPDHKRVYLEIVGTRQSNPISRKLMERAGRNKYKLTPLGRMRAAFLKESVECLVLHEELLPILCSNALAEWRRDPSCPTNVTDYDHALGNAQASELQAAVARARRWVVKHNVNGLAPDKRTPILRNDLGDIEDFVSAMEARFEKHRAKASARCGATRS